MNWFANLSIKTKLLLSFSAIIVVFSGFFVYLYVELGVLGDIQDAGANRSDDALKISQAVSFTHSIYAVAADAIINRHLSETRSEFQKIKSDAKATSEMVRALVDTPEEIRSADGYVAAVNKYLAAIESELLVELDKLDWTELVIPSLHVKSGKKF